MILIENSYQTIEFDDSASFMKITWHSATENMMSDEYKEQILIYVDKLKSHKPQKTLFNLLELGFTLSPDIQEWTDKNATAVEKTICKKQALVMPKSVFELITIEQLTEQEHGQELNHKFFDNESEAIKWLEE